MLHVPQYRRRWEEKLAWYRAKKILPSEEGGGQRAVLILTQDGANGRIDAAKISADYRASETLMVHQF
jgi:hypothetical protein